MLDKLITLLFRDQWRVLVRVATEDNTESIVKITVTNLVLKHKGVNGLVLMAFNKHHADALMRDEKLTFPDAVCLDLDHPIVWIMQVLDKQEGDHMLTLCSEHIDDYIPLSEALDGQNPQNNAFLYFMDRFGQIIKRLNAMPPECNNISNIQRIFERTFSDRTKFYPVVLAPDHQTMKA